MAESDKVFSSSIASIYDDLMGPVFFAPFAQDLARRAVALKPKSILETAAGSGISTAAIVEALPQAEVTATDLNQAMIDVARSKPNLARVMWQAGDATRLPFADSTFDLLASQFGVMFFPDKPAAYGEALRVLAPGGHFLFNVWDSLDVNPVPSAMLKSLAWQFPSDPPTFMRRLPHGYFNVAEIVKTLQAAGFTKVAVEQVRLPCMASSARHLAVALCQGTPTRAEIEARAPQGLERATIEVEQALARKFGTGKIESTMQAIVFTANF